MGAYLVSTVILWVVITAMYVGMSAATGRPIHWPSVVGWGALRGLILSAVIVLELVLLDTAPVLFWLIFCTAAAVIGGRPLWRRLRPRLVPAVPVRQWTEDDLP